MGNLSPITIPPLNPTTCQKSPTHYSLDRAAKCFHPNHKKDKAKRDPLASNL